MTDTERWDGQERRRMPQCEAHLDVVKSMAIIETTIVALDKRINGSLASIEKHMDQGIQWRIAIIGVAVTLLIQLILGIAVISRYGKQIEVNTKRLDVVEEAKERLIIQSAINESFVARLISLEGKLENAEDRLVIIENGKSKKAR
jgi:hypothetical protein